jgi:hypothetical protein
MAPLAAKAATNTIPIIFSIGALTLTYRSILSRTKPSMSGLSENHLFAARCADAAPAPQCACARLVASASNRGSMLRPMR